jgi:hypothetical protein
LISECDCTPLQCFYKGYIQSNQQLALSRLMHSKHCGSAIFPYQALQRRQAQETLLGCAGLHNEKFEGTENSPCVCMFFNIFSNSLYIGNILGSISSYKKRYNTVQYRWFQVKFCSCFI